MAPFLLALARNSRSLSTTKTLEYYGMLSADAAESPDPAVVDRNRRALLGPPQREVVPMEHSVPETHSVHSKFNGWEAERVKSFGPENKVYSRKISFWLDNCEMKTFPVAKTPFLSGYGCPFTDNKGHLGTPSLLLVLWNQAF